ncbi:hypothetical protein HanPI659440_Chr10g0378831 [Helianthus annuus]|nr:hypothetical protein HanPI659440_Chr10g0378831 [Helianthus annuus]
MHFCSEPLSFGSQDTRLVAGGDIDMYDPSYPKRTGPSPLGKPPIGGDSNISQPGPRLVDGGDNASSSPLWYETEAVLVCRELGGSRDAMDVDSAEALEKYVHDWSLVNKDRTVDALSAKMSLFHIGTLAE